MPRKALGSSFDLAATSGPGEAQALLQILLIAHQHIDIGHDPVRAPAAARSRPPEMFQSFSR